MPSLGIVFCKAGKTEIFVSVLVSEVSSAYPETPAVIVKVSFTCVIGLIRTLMGRTWRNPYLLIGILRLLFSVTNFNVLLKSNAATEESKICAKPATEALMLSMTSVVISVFNRVTWHLSIGISCVISVLVLTL